MLLLWLFATAALVAISASRPEESPGRRVRILDVLAVAAAAAAAIGFRRGALDSGTAATGGDATFLVLLPGLVCFAAAVATARLLGPLMRAGERLTRRSPPALRLAMLGLARAPARTTATAAFLVVAVGLALFATGYRATLERGSGDEAAFAVPLDFSLSEGPKLVTPLEAAPLARFDRIAPGVHAYPVVRQTAEVPGAGTSVLSPTVLGVPPAALAHLHWRRDFAALPLSTLAATDRRRSAGVTSRPAPPARSDDLSSRRPPRHPRATRPGRAEATPETSSGSRSQSGPPAASRPGHPRPAG